MWDPVTGPGGSRKAALQVRPALCQRLWVRVDDFGTFVAGITPDDEAVAYGHHRFVPDKELGPVDKNVQGEGHGAFKAVLDRKDGLIGFAGVDGRGNGGYRRVRK